MLLHFLLVVAFVGASLLAGILGYLYFENDHVKTRSDAFLNAAMLLGGMGPVHTPCTEGGKIFAAVYALYAGLFFLVAAGLLLAPVFHRLLHRFHWEQSTKHDSPRGPLHRDESPPAQPRGRELGIVGDTRQRWPGA